VPGTSPLGLTHSPTVTRSESSTGRSPPSREAPGRNLLAENGERQPFAAVPYFWSDQYDAKIQSVGLPGRAKQLHVLERSPDGRRFVAVGERAGRVVAAVGFNAARRMPFYRRELERRRPLEEVALAVAAADGSLAAGAPARREDARTPPRWRRRQPIPYNHGSMRGTMEPTPLTKAPFTVDHRRVRVAFEDEARWGRLDDGDVLLDSGERILGAEATFLAPVEPSKIIAVHLTYRSRVEEYDATIPHAPSYFMKPPTALNGHRGVIRRPTGARFLNYEGELAVVIGTPMHGVAEDEVIDHVAGYAPANDVGLHDFRHADRGAMLRVKGQDGFLPIGPELVPASEFDPRSFTLRTFVNGQVVQEGDAEDMLFPVAYQLADLNRLITLEPGDVVLTGTPANSRPMEVGDVVEVEISGLGRLTNTVEAWDVDLSGPGDQLEVSPNTLHVALAIPEEEAERMATEGRLA